MSIPDKLRSLAESREPDDAPVRDGLTYGDARQILRVLAEWARVHDAFVPLVKKIMSGEPVDPDEVADAVVSLVPADVPGLREQLRDMVAPGVRGGRPVRRPEGRSA